MRAPSLFIVGLLIGAVAIFLVRAVSQSEADPSEPSPAVADVPEEHTAHSDPVPSAVPSTVPTPPPAPAPALADSRPPENLVCPVMGGEVEPEIYVDHEGRRIGFCCPPCIEKFREDPETYLKKVDEELRTRDVIR